MAEQVVERPPGTSPLRMSYEEWLVWAPESRQAEWVDGDAIEFMPPKTVQALLATFLARLLGNYVDLFDLGTVIAAPYEMRLAHSAREPDILFIAREHSDRLTPERLLGAADLAVEIVSDDSVTRDGREKRAEYGAAGVPEYWLLDPRPRRRRAAFLQLGPDGVYKEAPLDGDGRYHSVVLPGFWLDPAWLWQDPLPKPAALLPLIAPDHPSPGFSPT